MPKILVVDDSPTVIAMLQVLFTQNGYEVITAEDGTEGLKKAKEEKPDLIFLDIMLPRIDGYKICRMLKFDEQYQKIPIIMFTTRVLDSDKQTGGEVGADAYLGKQAPPEEILATVKKLLEGPK
jgi:DNA-binding response OmpR family regulator